MSDIHVHVLRVAKPLYHYFCGTELYARLTLKHWHYVLWLFYLGSSPCLSMSLDWLDIVVFRH